MKSQGDVSVCGELSIGAGTIVFKLCDRKSCNWPRTLKVLQSALALLAVSLDALEKEDAREEGRAEGERGQQGQEGSGIGTGEKEPAGEV